MDIERIATGEHWFGYQALELQLVDTIETSDDYIISKLAQHRVVQVKYQLRKGLAEKVGMGSASIVSQWWQKLAQQNWLR